jgi:hypothetical protein
MSKFVSEQLSQSTAQVAASYFRGSSRPDVQLEPQILPPGVYRVVNGEVRQVLTGLPPDLVVLAETD